MFVIQIVTVKTYKIIGTKVFDFISNAMCLLLSWSQ